MLRGRHRWFAIAAVGSISAMHLDEITIVVAASSATAFAVAGGHSIASAAVAAFTPLRSDAAREPVEDLAAAPLDEGGGSI